MDAHDSDRSSISETRWHPDICDLGGRPRDEFWCLRDMLEELISIQITRQDDIVSPSQRFRYP